LKKTGKRKLSRTIWNYWLYPKKSDVGAIRT